MKNKGGSGIENCLHTAVICTVDRESEGFGTNGRGI